MKREKKRSTTGKSSLFSKRKRICLANLFGLLTVNLTISRAGLLIAGTHDDANRKNNC